MPISLLIPIISSVMHGKMPSKRAGRTLELLLSLTRGEAEQYEVLKISGKKRMDKEGSCL